ncbi:MAG: inosine/xanthosine triphosphatase [Thermoplasmata archaeon]
MGAPRRRRPTRVCVGGTFDRLHIAHRVLLTRAWEAAAGVRCAAPLLPPKRGARGPRGPSYPRPKRRGVVVVGVASDRMAARKGRGAVQSYAVRAAAVSRFLRSIGADFRVVRLESREGAAATEDFDAIVVSEETEPVARRINRLRRARGLRPLAIITVPMVPAEDGLPVSSSRIRSGELDREGRLRRLRVAVGSTNPVKLAAVRAALKRVFRGRRVSVRSVRVSPGVPAEPFGNDVIMGAVNRAREALRRSRADLGVGIEAGLFWLRALRDFLDVQYCAIADRGGRVTLGHGPGFRYPPAVIERVRAGETVGGAMGGITGIKRIGRKGGVVGYLSRGALDRRRLTESAVIAALIPRLSPGLYSGP